MAHMTTDASAVTLSKRNIRSGISFDVGDAQKMASTMIGMRPDVPEYSQEFWRPREHRLVTTLILHAVYSELDIRTALAEAFAKQDALDPLIPLRNACHDPNLRYGWVDEHG
jgi:hypothetical protein